MRLLPWKVSFGILLICVASCYDGSRGCNFDSDTCDNDYECGDGFICDAPGPISFGKNCISVTECASSDDCSSGEACQQRAAAPREHPFDPSALGKSVCTCVSFDCANSGSASSSGDASSSQSSGQGGAGTGGQGGAGGAGGAGQGGAGGAGQGGMGGGGGA
jgi:hypothetical protein